MSPLTQAYRPYLDRHQNLAGPGDERPTAIEVVKDLGLVGKLSDKTILITGCSAGLGVQAARALYLSGAKLYITVRNEQKGQKAIEAIMKDAPQGQTVEMVHMDLGDFDSVRAAAKDFLSRSDRLNILINNAGNYGHTMSPIRFDDMDFENAEYNPWVAYGQSKTANIYMANSIDRLYGSQGLHAVSVHPGVIFDTELIRHTTDDILAGLGGKGPFEKSEKSPEQGAATTVWAALTPHFDNNGGVYCADVGESVAAGENAPLGGPEYVSHAYDQKAEDRLWEFSCSAVGV
ncbi:putative short-chain dehydrogenase/reductase [Aureobasidium pullulans]|uniref:Putative short-chain dehydrogenase/reductase n=1 Tax=Aureobasidium pullulans TaxID=5580 RepID=A0A4S9MA06_AURPU|nr:putative short-chain dehydrogenase/reductase [Aureobasidium pullulans]THY21162.1 putative short-chain dehydrogenase/reductase [Aureobasidium pullulans]THY39538.1 putative short-chain dehydrogenase/reductase [Aureobasidium pullulans]THY49299.1 putative short-chain dehydrogenase/reductase [Aureobasidium pullulans]